MTFLEKIKPHLLSDDLLILETVLRALNDYPKLPEEWAIELLKEAFNNKDKQSSILIYIENQVINEEALKLLIGNILEMELTKKHLALILIDKADPELALKYRETIERLLLAETWALYELIVNGTEEAVKAEYEKLLNQLESFQYFESALYTKAKKLAHCIVKNGWITAEEIDKLIQTELKEQWFSYRGILTVYMIGLLKLEVYIPMLASLLVRDEDILLQEVAFALIGFQNDDVVRAVTPYLKKQESVIFATSVVENIKSDLAVEALREAYHTAEDIDEQDLIVEALCHQFSKLALPEIAEHMKKGHFSSTVDIEQTVYSCYSILGENHPDLEKWRQSALQKDMAYRKVREQGSILSNVPTRNDKKVGRNDPCTCGSGKKYKKCCGR